MKENCAGAGPGLRLAVRGWLQAWILVAAAVQTAALDAPAGIRVPGPGTRPEITFACCDQGAGPMQALFADPQLIPELKELDAGVAVAIEDFSPERAGVVRRLNQAGIPAIAWIVLPKEEGVYLNADNAPAAARRVSAFEEWTKENGLRWAAVGLDIEPNFAAFRALREHRLRLLGSLVKDGWNFPRMARAQRDYAALVAGLERDGFRVQTYQMPYVVAERREGSELADRLLGSVEVRGDEEYLMLYTGYARPAGAGLIWELGPGAQGIAIGSTDGMGAAGSGMGPLSWDEFSRDLIVASHFTRKVGVYNLEGCVWQGFLPRLIAMDWNAATVIPAQSVARAGRLGMMVRGLFWVSSHALVLLCCAALLIVALLRYRRNRRLRTTSVTAIRLRECRSLRGKEDSP
jgi:hypothetical protein